MHRCLQLAKLAAGNVAPNPMVGAVLVHKDRIIGEGYHKQVGEAHAEVNCINSISTDDKILISESTLYVSLEPCAHFGKTPPCTDLILAHRIPKVVMGCIDTFNEVNGKGLNKLKEAEVEVVAGILENEAKDLNKRFFTYHTSKRPYIILKWAQSANQKIAGTGGQRILISNEYSNRLVHKWRSEEAGIMVGTNTALADNPLLNVRLWQGKNPARIIIDFNLRLPSSLQVFDRKQNTIILNKLKHCSDHNLKYVMLQEEGSFVQQVLHACYQNQIQSILIEGGTQLLQTFIDEGIWDEARIIENNTLLIKEGLPAPNLLNQQLLFKEQVSTDTISYYQNTLNTATINV